MLYVYNDQAKGEQELPEYLLGTVRVNRIEVESAVTNNAGSPNGTKC